MRSIPGMVVLSPADDVEARAAVKAAIDYKGPVYIRFGRLAVPVFNNPETYHFEMGKGVTLRDGKDLTIIATGLMVWEALVSCGKPCKRGHRRTGHQHPHSEASGRGAGGAGCPGDRKDRHCGGT